jgi:hypothetical protein
MRIAIVISSAAFLAIACAHGKESEAQAVEVKSTGVPGQAAATTTATYTATVKAVDVPNRIVTLQGQDGKMDTVKVDPAVERLPEIVPGDVVQVRVSEGLLLEYQAPGTEAVAPQSVVVGGTAGSDSPPGAAAVGALQGTVTVIEIDERHRIVTFQDANGNPYKVKAGPKIQLEKLKVGDRLLATYAQSVAINIQRPQ